MDDHFFPDRTPIGVLQKVNLVKDHCPHIIEEGRIGIDHVAQDLGSHDQDLCPVMDGDISSEEADSVSAVDLYEISILLIGKRLNGSGVEGPEPTTMCTLDPVFGYDGLAATRGRSHNHMLFGIDGIEGIDLKSIHLESVAREDL
jgi:hypothetical protein